MIALTGDALRLANPPRGVALAMPALAEARARVPAIPVSGRIDYLQRHQPDVARPIVASLKAAHAPTEVTRAAEILWCIDDVRHHDDDYDALAVWLADALGVVGALEALGRAGALCAESKRPVAGYATFSAHWRALGRVIALASESDHAAARTLAARWRDDYPTDAVLRASIAMIFPSEVWATEDARVWVTRLTRTDTQPVLMALMANTDLGAAEQLVASCHGTWDSPEALAYPAHALVYRFGEAAVGMLVTACEHAMAFEWRGPRGTWCKNRILDALRFVSPAEVERLAAPRTIRATANVSVKGEYEIVGELASWTGPSRAAVDELATRTWKKGERLEVTIARGRIHVLGSLRGATFLFEAKTIARMFCLPPDAGVQLAGQLVFFEPASSRGLRVRQEPGAKPVHEDLDAEDR